MPLLWCRDVGGEEEQETLLIIITKGFSSREILPLQDIRALHALCCLEIGGASNPMMVGSSSVCLLK